MNGLNELSEKIHGENVRKGFWDERKKLLLMKWDGESEAKFVENMVVTSTISLAIGELSECIEALRNGALFDDSRMRAFLANKERNYNEFSHAEFKKHIKDTPEDEIADCIIRLLDLCGALGVDIESHIKMKLEYNAGRPRKHGKQF